MKNLNNLTEANKFNLTISPEISDELEKRFIFFSDIEKVVVHSLTTGERFFNPDDLSFLANLRLDNVTYWVRYEQREDGINIMSVYSHRMEIVKE